MKTKFLVLNILPDFFPNIRMQDPKTLFPQTHNAVFCKIPKNDNISAPIENPIIPSVFDLSQILPNMPKKIVFFHIGQPKCASTHLQYVFELKQKELLQQGIAYHTTENNLEKISSGNICPGELTISRIHERITQVSQLFPEYNLLFSSEFAWRFLAAGNLHALSQLCESAGYRLHILWVFRETMPLISSIMSQRLKSLTPDAPSGLSFYIDMSQKIVTNSIQLIEQIHALDIAYSLFSLSNSKAIEVDVFKSMGIELNSVPPSKKSNRSMTKREHSLLSALRFVDQPLRLELGNALSVAHPRLKPWRVEFSFEETKQIAAATNPLIDEFNRLAKNSPVLNQISEHSAQMLQKNERSMAETQELYFDEEEIKVIESWLNKHFIPKNELKTFVWNAIKHKIIWILTLRMWRS